MKTTTYDLYMRLLAIAGLHPVRGGSEAVATPGATDDDVVEVDGEKFSRQELEDFRNNKDWRRSNEERSAEAKRQEAANASERDRLNEEARLSASKEANRLDQERSTRQQREESEALDLSGLPNESEEPEAYRQELQSRMREALAKGQQQVAREFETKLRDATRATESRLSRAQQQQQAYSANEQTCRDYFAELEAEGIPVDDATQKQIMRNMDKMLRIDGMGETDGAGVFRFNREAVATAEYGARKDFYRNRDREAGFQEGLTQRRKNGEAGEVVLPSNRPADNATPTQLWEYGSQLPPESAEAREFFDSLTDEQTTAFIQEDRDQRIGSSMGGEYI